MKSDYEYLELGGPGSGRYPKGSGGNNSHTHYGTATTSDPFGQREHGDEEEASNAVLHNALSRSAKELSDKATLSAFELKPGRKTGMSRKWYQDAVRAHLAAHSAHADAAKSATNSKAKKAHLAAAAEHQSEANKFQGKIEGMYG